MAIAIARRRVGGPKMSIGIASLSVALSYDRMAQVMTVQYRDSNGAVRAQTPTNAAILLKESSTSQEPSHVAAGRISLVV